METEVIKWCPTCKSQKPASEFYKNKKDKLGLDSYCKPCRKRKQARAFRKNPRLLTERART